MTVGQEPEKLTGFKLFHNCLTIELPGPFFELLVPFFGFSPVMWELSEQIRVSIFRAFAETNPPGLIFTYVWAFYKKEDWNFIEKVCAIFEEKGGEVFFVEPEADLEERLKRNQTPNRLEHKPSKRDVKSSEKELLESMEKNRFHSYQEEINRKNYIKINNTRLSPLERQKSSLNVSNFNFRRRGRFGGAHPKVCFPPSWMEII